MQTTLETLLDQTRDAVLAGDFSTLSELAPQIAAQADSPPHMDLATAGKLQQKAERNAQLLLAATRGIRAAQGRLGEITAGPTLTTYDARGQKAAISLASARQPHRI